jgi:hypothetical protein
MAEVIATINVNFTSNYVGCHRLFWRKGSSGPYTGPILATPPCTGGGNPCTITFYDVVNSEACEPTNYEGYVQACCEDETSVVGRIPWTVTFTPSPTCLPITITCSAVEIADIIVDDPGSGYDPLNPPTVTLVGGGFSVLATADAIVGEGTITNLLIVDAGVGPDQAPATYGPVAGANIVGTGTAVTVTVTSLNTVPGPPYPSGGNTYINTVTLNTSSNDWTVGDTFELDPTGIGNIGTVLNPVIITVGATDEGQIIGFTITDPGSGYTSVPSVSIDPPPGVGTQATATAIMGSCPDAFVVGPNCDGNDYSAFPIEPAFGQEFTMCFQGGAISSGSLPSEYTAVVSTTECCIDCVSVQFQNLGDQNVEVSWIDCCPLSLTYKDVISDIIPASGVLEIECAVNNSWALSSTDNIIENPTTDCDCTIIS